MVFFFTPPPLQSKAGRISTPGLGQSKIGEFNPFPLSSSVLIFLLLLNTHPCLFMDPTVITVDLHVEFNGWNTLGIAIIPVTFTVNNPIFLIPEMWRIGRGREYTASNAVRYRLHCSAASVELSTSVISILSPSLFFFFPIYLLTDYLGALSAVNTTLFDRGLGHVGKVSSPDRILNNLRHLTKRR